MPTSLGVPVGLAGGASEWEALQALRRRDGKASLAVPAGAGGACTAPAGSEMLPAGQAFTALPAQAMRRHHCRQAGKQRSCLGGSSAGDTPGLHCPLMRGQHIAVGQQPPACGQAGILLRWNGA